MDIVAIIHAKGESDRVFRKNLKRLGGVPLVVHAILNAQDSKATKVVVDSDDEEILNIGLTLKTDIIKRPKLLFGKSITPP